jgi:hypothetical protein
MWGSDPVHPSKAAFQVITDGISRDILNTKARYMNPPKSVTKDVWIITLN